MNKLGLIILTLFLPLVLFSQQIVSPNFALASHPMKINKIELTDNQTIIELTIENQTDNGNFCADKNIYIQDLGNKKKYQLIKSTGIPVCPDHYNFNFVGESLTFKLYFPKINTSTKFINLIENCNQYCFSIKGIILDEEMNKSIDLGYDYYAQGKLDFALQAFKQAIEEQTNYPFGIFHLNMIQIFVEKNDFVNAKKWYNKILTSDFQDKNEVLERLKTSPYYSKLTL